MARRCRGVGWAPLRPSSVLLGTALWYAEAKGKAACRQCRGVLVIALAVATAIAKGRATLREVTFATPAPEIQLAQTKFTGRSWERPPPRPCRRPSQALGRQAEVGAQAGSSVSARRTPLWTLKALQMLIFAANVCLMRYLMFFYDKINLSRAVMGMLFVVLPMTSFLGGLFWSGVVDRCSSFKGTLVFTSLCSIAAVFAYLVPSVQERLPLLVGVTALHGFFAGPSSPLVDGLCLKVLSEQTDTKEGYGDQRLWSAVGWGGMALIAGKLVDCFGCPAMFLSFGAIVALNVGIVLMYMPSGGSAAANRAQGSSSSLLPVLLRFESSWLLLNIVIYGVLMALVENFLNVFLLQDFVGGSPQLLGAATLVMCAFEIPVFKYIGGIWKSGRATLVDVLTAAEFVLAARCVLYAILPRHLPWLVLLIEPLHGFTFAAMWCATVEYARRLAPPGSEAKMQAVVNGLFSYVALGTGSLLWGFVVRRPPMGLGFTASFYLDAGLILVWLAVWKLGWRYSRSRGGDLKSTQA